MESTPLQTKEEKEKQRRKRRKEMQKKKRKEDKNNLRKGKGATSIVFTGNDVLVEPTPSVSESTTLTNANQEKNASMHSISTQYNSTNAEEKRAIGSTPHYQEVLDGLQMDVTALSRRKVIISFFTRLFEEYASYGETLPPDKQSEWKNRCAAIQASLTHLSFYMKKSHRAVPERIINKLVSIRTALLCGDGNRADELYLDMDVGNIVPTNPAYSELQMDCDVLCRSLTNIKRLMNFFCSTMILGNQYKLCLSLFHSH